MSQVARDLSFDLLRFPLAIVILVVHVFSVTGIPTQYGTSHTQIFPVIQDFINAFVRGHSVPIFFFISGYVFFLGRDLTCSSYFKKLKTRFYSLFLPYTIWNAIALLIAISVSINLNRELNINIENVISCFWSCDGEIIGLPNSLGLPINGPTWFLRDLMLVVIIAPLLNVLLKGNRGGFFMTILFVLYLCNNCGLDVMLPIPITSLFFFSFGAYISLNNGICTIKKFGKLSIFLYIILGTIYLLFDSEIPNNYLNLLKGVKIFVGIFVAYNLAHRLLKTGCCKVNTFLASSSFFIYISHGIVYGPVLNLMFIIIQPETTFSMFIVYIMACLLIIAVLLVVYYVIKRHTPSLALIITGGR